jgi:hypothetical protein
MAAIKSADIPSQSQPSRVKSLGRLYVFPNEILIIIIQYVRPAKHLLQLALCSHDLLEVAEPVLYTRFMPAHDRSLAFFLCRLLSRPSLATCTQSFSGLSLPRKKNVLDVSRVEEKHWALVQDVIAKASKDKTEADLWTKATKRGAWDALVALFMCITPNLQELWFEEWGATRWIYSILECAVDFQNMDVLSPYAMSNLREIRLISYGPMSGLSFDELELFLKLKSLRRFEAGGVSEDNGDDLKDAKPQNFVFGTTDLTFTHSYITHTDMAYWFKHFPYLERLCYEHTKPYASFEAPRMMAAIEHVKPCLKDLIIRFDGTDAGAEFKHYPIGSLTGFQNLTSIDVTAFILIGEDLDDEHVMNSKSFPNHQRLVDSVPPTLKKLSLRDCQVYQVPHILELVSNKAVKIPLLERLELYWGSPTLRNVFSKEKAAELIAACDAAGIEITISSA